MRCVACLEEMAAGQGFCTRCGAGRHVKATQAFHLAPGTVLQGRYSVGLSIGSGGFGVTYVAFDALMQRKVALKEYLPTAFASRREGEGRLTVFSGESATAFSKGLESFIGEGRRLAALTGVEGITQIYDAFEANGTGYITMEMLHGRTVRERLSQEGAYAWEQAAPIILAVLDALAAVHAQGIIHRDIAPDNIFITREGSVKLIDFGAARVQSGLDERSLTVVLKPGYAPREQYTRKGVQGPWTDVYATAATLYKMLTGITPEESLERAHRDELRPPSVLGVVLPQGVEIAIMRALAVNAAERTQSAVQLRQGLLSGLAATQAPAVQAQGGQQHATGGVAHASGGASGGVAHAGGGAHTGGMASGSAAHANGSLGEAALPRACASAVPQAKAQPVGRGRRTRRRAAVVAAAAAAVVLLGIAIAAFTLAGNGGKEPANAGGAASTSSPWESYYAEVLDVYKGAKPLETLESAERTALFGSATKVPFDPLESGKYPDMQPLPFVGVALGYWNDGRQGPQAVISPNSKYWFHQSEVYKAFADLNGDGSDEMILGLKNPEMFNDPAAFSNSSGIFNGIRPEVIYTLDENNRPALLYEGFESVIPFMGCELVELEGASHIYGKGVVGEGASRYELIEVAPDASGQRKVLEQSLFGGDKYKLNGSAISTGEADALLASWEGAAKKAFEWQPLFEQRDSKWADLFYSLASQANERIVSFCYADYDSDGRYEAYAVTTTDNGYNDLKKATIWYIDGSGSQRIEELAEGLAQQPKGIVEAGEQAFFVVETGYQTASRSHIYGVRPPLASEAGQPYQPQLSNKMMGFHSENGELVAASDEENGIRGNYEYTITLDSTTGELAKGARR